MGIPKHFIVLLRNLYENQLAVITTEHGETTSFQVKKGVQQGCILSPYLFNLYTERIMRMAGLNSSFLTFDRTPSESSSSFCHSYYFYAMQRALSDSLIDLSDNWQKNDK